MGATNNRILVGTVASIEPLSGRPFVTVARRFGIGRTLGPCPILLGVHTPAVLVGPPAPAVSGAASAGTAHTHTIGHDHTVANPALAAGDSVLVAITDDGTAVVFGRLL